MDFPGNKPTRRREARSALAPSRCFVKTRCGAIVREGAGFNSAMVAELPYRVVVTVVGVAENANGARCRISAPVHGWLSYKTIELYPRTSPAPVEECADPEEQAALEADRAAAEQAVALARFAEAEGGFSSDDDSFDSDASSYAMVEELEGPDFFEAGPSGFEGYRHGYYYGTRDGKTGYCRDTEEYATNRKRVPDAVDGAPGEPYRVIGLLGARVRAHPELHSPTVGEPIEEGVEARRPRRGNESGARTLE